MAYHIVNDVPSRLVNGQGLTSSVETRPWKITSRTDTSSARSTESRGATPPTSEGQNIKKADATTKNFPLLWENTDHPTKTGPGPTTRTIPPIKITFPGILSRDKSQKLMKRKKTSG